jgi:group I intron endonuclease
MASGIYKIESKIKPERIYIGSAVNIEARWSAHKSALVHNKHSSAKLQNHFKKYGIDDLKFSIIAVCDRNELIPISGIIRPEQFFMWAYDPYFNSCPIAGSSMGRHHSEETKRKIGDKSRALDSDTRERIRQKLIGKKRSADAVEKSASKLRGRHHSDETKKKISEKNRGRPAPNKGEKMSEEFCRQCSTNAMGNKSWLGKKHSEETKKKMSESAKGKHHGMAGKHHTESAKKKMSDNTKGHNTWTKGLKRSKETKEKLSKAIKQSWIKRKAEGKVLEKDEFGKFKKKS